MSLNVRTADQAKVEYVQAMGQDLGETYHMLWQQLALLHTRWNEYVVLFGTSEERFKLVMSAAPKFFSTTQTALWEAVLLHIAKLTDRAITFGRPNLTIQRLVALIPDPSLQQKIQDLVDEALRVCEFARDWRNRHVAHIDLEHALDSTAKPLAPASRLGVRAALKALDAVLNGVAQHYLQSTSFFDSGVDDAEHLLYVIYDGQAASRARHERIKTGQYTHDDIHRLSL